MPVTLKIEDKTETAAVTPVDLADYAIASERADGTKAFLLWLLFIFVIAGGMIAAEWTRTLGIIVFAWWLLACLGYFYFAPRAVLRRLRLHGAETVLNSKNQPRLKTTLSKASSLLGVGEPESFLTEGGVAQTRIAGASPPYYMIVTKGAVEVLHPAELDCLVIRSLVHARQGHVRRLTLLQLLHDTPPAVRFLAWPVGLYAFFLRLWWADSAEQTADRLTLLLLKNHKLLVSTILKQYAAADPLMQEANITPQDVDNYIRQGNVIGTSGMEISTQYKIGQAIHENSYLEGRLQALEEWFEAPEYKEAVEKLASTRSGRLSGN